MTIEKARGPRREDRDSHPIGESNRERKSGTPLEKLYLIKNYPEEGFT